MLMQVSGCYRRMLIAVRGTQPGKSDPVQSPCGRCRGVGVRLQVSGSYESLQATPEIMTGSVHADARGMDTTTHDFDCRLQDLVRAGYREPDPNSAAPAAQGLYRITFAGLDAADGY